MIIKSFTKKTLKILQTLLFLTVKDQFKYMEKYGKKGGYYIYKLAEDVWAKRDDKFKINNLGVLAHEIGHLLGASEVWI